MKITDDKILTSKILIVDDNPANVALLEMVLVNEGFTQVHSTMDPRTVIACYLAEHFDLILLDIRMPYMDGFEVMAALNAHMVDDYLPILVLTAQQDLPTRQKALKSGAKDFLTKPFNPEEVLQRIRNMLEVRILYLERLKQTETLETKVQERTKALEHKQAQLRETRLEIVHCLGRAGEYRDNETGMHVVRMSKFTQHLALVAGYSESYADMLLNASPMHDVGKIGIPDNVLLKPGKLDAEEWVIMQTHTSIGGEILGDHPSEMMHMAHTIAVSHHEKWDGSGYPKQLRGEAIPLEGRLSAVCDVFDALTSTRPYKEPWPLDKALNLIKEGAGSHFDPTLVPLFLNNMDAILDIQKAHKDEA